MSIAAVPLDSAAMRPASASQSAPYSAIVRSPTEEAYNETADMSFGDFLDMVNPLQHIPVVGTIYRAVTGDTIKPASQVIGGIAFGGPVGGIGAIVSAIFAQANGRSLEDSMLTAVGLGKEEAPFAVAEAPKSAPQDPVQAAALPAAALPAAAQAAAVAPQAAPSAPAPAVPPVALASATPAASSRPAEKAAAPLGEHRPSKMPARDTMLANTLQAKQAASLATKTAALPPKGPALPPGSGATSPAPANAPVPPEMISDVMMRNLAKYEAAKKALNPTPPNLRVAG